mgnify:CR=1 FL=1
MDAMASSAQIPVRAKEVLRGGAYTGFRVGRMVSYANLPCEMLMGTELLDIMLLFALGMQRAASVEASATASVTASADVEDTASANGATKAFRTRPVAVACCAREAVSGALMMPG